MPIKSKILKKSGFFFLFFFSRKKTGFQPWCFNDMVLQYFGFTLICRNFIRKEFCKLLHSSVNNFLITFRDPFLSRGENQFQHRAIRVVILLHKERNNKHTFGTSEDDDFQVFTRIGHTRKLDRGILLFLQRETTDLTISIQ